ncbi:MAG: iron chaperone [Candidatus Limnocylindrales bacterium]|jgi:uncharacterized protein YdhG (YjbR/CyaY superfamily)
MPAQTIDEYLAGLADDKRGALERLRAQIRAAAPDATEAMSYGRPALRLGGRYFVGFGVTRNGCSFFAGRAPLDAHAGELTGYRTWKGTINFTLPVADDPVESCPV